MLKMLRPILERFWVWLGGELPDAEIGIAVEPGPRQFFYVVQPGDTLGSIARSFSTSVWVLTDVNDLEKPGLIRVGQRLLIPRPGAPVMASSSTPKARTELRVETESGPFIYIVKTGDTLSSIGRHFGVELKAIIETNRIQDPDLIRPGQRLLIPGPELQPVSQPAPAQVESLPSVPSESEPTPLPLLESTPAQTPATRPIPVLRRELGQDRATTTTSDELSPIPWPEDAIRGIYVSYFALGDQSHRRHICDMLTKTEINALVIDVKSDRGLISYPTSVPLAQNIDAAHPSAVDFNELMDFFKANNVYTIARIVTFKDPPFANAYPEWAVQREKGGLWHDRDRLAWVDPFIQATWKYNADLAAEAARRGFDEIQFDFVRFPTRSQDGVPHFSKSPSQQLRVASITAFLSYVRGWLSPLGVSVAANVFGYTCWREDDTLIGQDIWRMAQHLDVLCPMLYPSTFGSGVPGYENAVAFPYEIVYESTKRAVHRIGTLDCRVRPWLQDFPDYRFDGRVYGRAEIRAQMLGSFDGGGHGYMAWNPRIKYTIRAYFQKSY